MGFVRRLFQDLLQQEEVHEEELKVCEKRGRVSPFFYFSLFQFISVYFRGKKIEENKPDKMKHSKKQEQI